MLGIWNDSLNGPYQGGEELAINGLSWPFTERLTYTQHVPVNWRAINASNQVHPMHLHGFFYNVNSRGESIKILYITKLTGKKKLPNCYTRVKA